MTRASSRANTYWLLRWSFSRCTSWPASRTSARSLRRLDVVEDPLPRGLAPAGMLEVQVDDDLEAGGMDPHDGRRLAHGSEPVVGGEEPADDRRVQPREAHARVGEAGDGEGRLDGQGAGRFVERRTALLLGGPGVAGQRVELPRHGSQRLRRGVLEHLDDALSRRDGAPGKIGGVLDRRVEIAARLRMRRGHQPDVLEILLHRLEEGDGDHRAVEDERIEGLDAGLLLRRTARCRHAVLMPQVAPRRQERGANPAVTATGRGASRVDATGAPRRAAPAPPARHRSMSRATRDGDRKRTRRAPGSVC